MRPGPPGRHRAAQRPGPPGPRPGPGPGKPPPGGGKTPARTAADAVQEARACLTSGNDQACCINALRGAPKNRTVVSLLVSCYDGAGQTRRACDLARQYQSIGRVKAFFLQRCQ